MASNRSGEKSAAAFRTISEVSDDLQVPQHVLRFWETKFSQVRPMKRGGGRRYYRPEDIELLRRIRDLLYTDGYTIKGVQKLLREGQVQTTATNGGPTAKSAPAGSVSGEAQPASAQAGTAQSSQAAAAGQGLSNGDRRALEEVLNELSALRDTLRGGQG
ncbi:MerR family transcriptional regulator [Ferruginivarius sediminum]|uniref:MerR family transcriptional regulator n=1 Tax=Ferruginivarius sediminum TaxID=2661937 RepID=A0A369TLL8_9PROT|nr:MerR family transcriptional regulator [Ferruginivarius sediminum]RDD63796.1 MerR family transcriptional regulator [Ferruginivarius sediminum]